MIINNFILKFLSPIYHSYLTDIIKLEHNGYDSLEQISNDKLSIILNHAVSNVPFYKNYFGENKTKGLVLNDFPLINKDIMRSNFDNFIALNIDSKRRKVNSTSGSTGNNFTFFSDKVTDNIRHACVNLGEKWSGGGFGERMLLIWGAERDLINKGLRSKLINSKFLFNIKKLSSYHLKDIDIKNSVIPTIHNFDPKLIVGYPSSLKYLATYFQEHNIKINKSLNGIICSGETLSIDQREIIESTFKVKVFNRYGCRDVGPIAHECENHCGLHVFSNHVHVEILNENGKECKPGEIGEIVVTDLDNEVFPFIRYKIGDLGKWSDKNCKCGRNLPLLESIEGRTFDLIIGTNGNKVPGNYFTLLRQKFKNIEQFQIIQPKIGQIKVKLKTFKNDPKIDEQNLISVFKSKLGSQMKIDIEYVDKFEVTKTGKFKWITSKVNLYE